VAFAEDDEVIEDFVLGVLHPGLGEDHAHVPGDLGHPDAVGIRRHAGDVNATGMEVDEEQDVVRDRAADGPDGFGEEVRGPDGLDVPLDEVVPAAMAAFRPRIEAMLLEDAGDGRHQDGEDAQLSQLAEDTSVAPAGTLGHLNNELADLFRLPGLAPFTGFDARLGLAQPAGKGPRVNNGDHLLDGRSQCQAEFYEFGPLSGCDFYPLGELVAENPVLGLEVLDHLDEFFLGGPDQEEQEGMDEPLHVGTMRKSLSELEVAYF